MEQTIDIKGMTCSSCVSKVTQLLSEVKGVQSVEVSLSSNKAVLTTDHSININLLNAALPEKYSLTEDKSFSAIDIVAEMSWFKTYKPILIIFGYITILSLIIASKASSAPFMAWMNSFMAGFFLIFSFFKFLDLTGFANSYAMYDVIAIKWKSWGYIYAFVELGLGLSYAANCCPLLTNWLTLIVMSISLIGVLKSVRNKQKIQCACLGTIFNLPMTAVTIIEDFLMILMSLMMLVLMK